MRVAAVLVPIAVFFGVRALCRSSVQATRA
jgi:hypothetical protein